MSKKIVGQKKFSEKKNFRKKNLVKQNSWSKKILVKKVFAHKKILFKKIFWLKKSLVKNVLDFCQKKLGRVNPGAGIYDPPPPENGWVKILLWNCC